MTGRQAGIDILANKDGDAHVARRDAGFGHQCGLADFVCALGPFHRAREGNRAGLPARRSLKQKRLIACQFGGINAGCRIFRRGDRGIFAREALFRLDLVTAKRWQDGFIAGRGDRFWRRFEPLFVTGLECAGRLGG